MKRALYNLLIVACIAGIAYRQLDGASNSAPKRPEAAAPSKPFAIRTTKGGSKENPGFDIINKTGKEVSIRVVNGDTISIPYAVVKPAQTILGKTASARNQNASIDTNQPTLLVVWDTAISDPKKDIYTGGVGITGEGTPAYFNNWLIVPKPAYIYHFKLGKSIYVTLDKNGQLKPQTGPSRGTTGKTEAGYPLANEVEQTDIMSYKKAINSQGGLTKGS